MAHELSELHCPHCGFSCVIPSATEEKIECPSCRKIFLYIQQSKRHTTIDYRPSPEIDDKSIRMSELKARMLGQTMNEYGCNTKIYLKPEADKVIAELEDKLKVQTSIAEEGWKTSGTYHTSYAEAVKELYEKNKQLRRHKYKRCLAMADYCYTNVHCIMGHRLCALADFKRDWFERWHKRWLELAEKFKETK